MMTKPLVGILAEENWKVDLQVFQDLGVDAYPVEPSQLPDVILLNHCKNLEILRAYKGFVVLDELQISSPADLCQHIQLFPYLNLLMVSQGEAERLLKRSLSSQADLIMAAEDILAMGVKSVMIMNAMDGCLDYWTDGCESFWLSTPSGNRVGLSSLASKAVASCIALNYCLRDALVIAKMYVNRTVRQPFSRGWPQDEIDLPVLRLKSKAAEPVVFRREDLFQLGLYPIVDSLVWLKLLAPLGIQCIQLRLKDKSQKELSREINESIQFAKQFNLKLFINDYWQLAMEFGAYGVHLGQDDLDLADVQAIHSAGLRLGISTNSYAEVARAHGFCPSYIACGPIFTTTSKVVLSAPQGLTALQEFRKILTYPIVAIGGIQDDNLEDILATKVDGVALISAITKADNPLEAAKRLNHQVNNLLKC